MLATAWSGYQLWNTGLFHDDFSKLITKGACGVNLLPTYWAERSRFEIPILALNVIALVVSAILSWRLMKVGHYQYLTVIHVSHAIIDLRLANLQTRGRITFHQPGLQTRLDVVSDYST